MADNYIERKMEELEARKAMPKKPVSNRAGHKRRVFVTGGASGIGKAIVKAFSNEGYRVAFCDRDAEQGKETSKETGALFFPADVSDKEARCGVRCATRDHLPMVGNVPDYEATLVEYASLAEQKDEAVSAPVFDDLFMFAALGSRGLCSAPLCAEILAAQMSDEPIPMDASTLAALNPNRLWVRKLLKGKAVKAG